MLLQRTENMCSCRHVYCRWYGARRSSPLMSTLMCSRIAPLTADLSVLFSARLSSIRVPQTSALTQVVPDIHFTAECVHFDDGLTEEIVRLSRESLP